MSLGNRYTFGTQLPLALEEARRRVEAALQAEGFGVLTAIDVAATLRAKLGLEPAPYLILGACNPSLAHRALEVDPSIGALLPCNVVLRADSRSTIVEAMDPEIALGIAANPALADITAEARLRLQRVINALESQA